MPSTAGVPPEEGADDSAAAAISENMHLRDLLALDDAFAVTTFTDFAKKNYPASGPIEEALARKTGCASMLVIAGCMLWVARRLERVTDVSRCYHAAEALLCYQASAAYFGEWQKLPEAKTAAERAVRSIAARLWSVYAKTPGSHSCWPPAKTAGEAVTITRTILGPSGKEPFEVWLKEVLRRIAIVASNPRHRVGSASDFASRAAFEEQIAINVGPPLPPDLLRLDARGDMKPSALGEHYARFLGRVDPAANPFLAAPAAMLEKGFVGTPYQIGPLTYPVVDEAERADAAESREASIASSPSPPGAGESPYPFLRSLEALPEAKQQAALRAYLAERGKPETFGPEELALDHAFGLLLGAPVSPREGTYVGILEVSLDVVGDLAILVDDRRHRPAALRAFEPEIVLSSEASAPARAVLLEAVEADVLDVRAAAPPGELIAVRAGDHVVGRITRDELGEIADALTDFVVTLRMIAPSDGTLFDALRYMLQKENEPWGMTAILDASEMTVESLDAKLEAALLAIASENRALADALAPFCDTYGRSARAWQWNGRDRKAQAGVPALRFVAGIRDGEGVGMEFNVYRIAAG